MQGNTLYVTDARDGLSVVDLSNPMVPQMTGTYFPKDSNGEFVAADDVWVKGEYGFLATPTNTLKVLRFTANNDPILARVVTGFSSTPLGVSGSGDVVYVIDGDSLYCFDAANPLETHILGTTSCTGRFIELAGEGKVVTWNPASGTQMFDVSDPLHPTQLEVDSLPDEAGQFAYSGALACIATAQGVQFLDWSDPSQATTLGSYSEGSLGNITGVSAQGSVLLAWNTSSSTTKGSLWIIDIGNPSNPRFLSKIERSGTIDSVVMPDDSHLIISNSGRPALYDLTDRTHPVLLSFMTNVHMVGDMAYRDKFLFGTSAHSGLGFQAVDYADPVHPVLVSRSNPYRDTSWSVGVAGKAGFVFASIYSPKNELRVYDVTVPATPTLACTLPSSSTSFPAAEIELKGNTLFLKGGSIFEQLAAFDISNPLDPQLKSSYRLPVPNNGSGFAVSAGVAYMYPGSGKGPWALDISQPDEARVLNNTFAPDASQVVTSGPNIITAEGSYGISIYHHTFAKPPTEVTFTCAGLIHPDTRELHFKIYTGEPSENGCGSSTFISAKPLVDCRLGCISLNHEGTASCVSETTGCEQVISTWVDSVVAAIDDQAADMLRVTRTGDKSFMLESVQPFYGALYGEELELPGQENRVLYDCPINNLMDGIDGNENAAEVGGFSIEWSKQMETQEATPTVTPTVTPSPTITPSETSLFTPSFTETATETPLPTLTGTPTPTATGTMDGDVVPDGEINSKDLLEVIRQIDGEAETERSGLLFDFSRAWKP